MARLVSRFGVTRYEADEYYRIALASYQKKNLDEAVLNINQAIEMYPRRSEYYAARGFFNLQEGLPAEKVEPDFDQSLSINPYEVLGNYGKGVLCFNREEYTQALDYFIKSWAADNERPETLYYIALIHHRNKDNVQAKQWMQQAQAKYAVLAENDRDAKKSMKNAEKWLKQFDKLILQAQKIAEKEAKSQK